MKLQIKRLISQFFFFFSANLNIGALFQNNFAFKTGFCYPFFYCNSCPTATSACPLRALEVGVYDKDFKWKVFLFPILILGAVGIISGRAVCGWACPIGLLQRGTGKIARKFKKYPLFQQLGKHPIESYLRYTKYILLIGFVLFTTWYIAFMFTNLCPVGVLTGTFPTLLLYPGEFVPNPIFFWPAMIIFALFLILIFTIERGWCRYFCPIGAILAPFNKISIYHVERVPEKIFQKECLHCNACTNICPMGIDVVTMHRDPECVLCGKCIEICPKNLIQYKK